jgi:hypothetical protein
MSEGKESLPQTPTASAGMDGAHVNSLRADHLTKEAGHLARIVGPNLPGAT